eukprot:NODE_710_length_4537_cov_0.398828.p4 type:complete len:184 gc:universal NODE_710_length_4537_cov_0.398828:225-776(+)
MILTSFATAFSKMSTMAYVPPFCPQKEIVKAIPIITGNPSRECMKAMIEQLSRRKTLEWGLVAICHQIGKFPELDPNERTVFQFPSTGGKGTVAYFIDSGFNQGIGTFKHKVRKLDFTQKQGRRSRNDFSDPLDHGTYCAAIIGSQEYGVAPEAELVSLKVIQKDGAPYETIANAIEFVLDDM